jgi:hypothetical protein
VSNQAQMNWGVRYSQATFMRWVEREDYMAKIGLAASAKDKYGQVVRKGDRVVFYKPRWWGLFGNVRAEGTVGSIIDVHMTVNIFEDDAKPGTFAWGRQGFEIERI